MKTITVETDSGAAEYIREHGGRLFIWVSDAGLEHETIRPKEGINFIELRGDGFSLHVDPAIEMPARWSLVFHRFPRPHVRALWNGGAWSPNGARMPQWEGESPWGTH